MGPKRQLSNKSPEDEKPIAGARRSTRSKKQVAEPMVDSKPETKYKASKVHENGKMTSIKSEEADEKTPKKKSRLTMKSVIKTEPDAANEILENPISANFDGKKFVGAHTSISGGLEKSVLSAVKMGAKSFGLFLRSQRQWGCKPLTEEVAQKFIRTCKQHGFLPDYILPHGSYLLNCGAPNVETLSKSRNTLIDELQRCEKLELTMYNFHPGSSCGKIATEECIEKIAESINQAHKATKYITTLIENMCCQGHTIGGDFKQLRSIIDKVEDKSRIGICLDTCHAFAAGYDLATENGYIKMTDDLKNIIGIKYLKAVHLNDSKGKVGSHLDRHENIGEGFIGIEGFRRIMNDPLFNNMPMILETPWVTDDINMKEIQLLYSLCK